MWWMTEGVCRGEPQRVPNPREVKIYNISGFPPPPSRGQACAGMTKRTNCSSIDRLSGEATRRHEMSILPAIFMSATTIAALLWLAFNPGSGYLIVGKRILGITAVLLVILAGFVAFEGVWVIGGLRKK